MAATSKLIPEHDGGLSEDQVFVTFPLDDEVSDPPDDHVRQLEELGLDIDYEVSIYRLMDDAAGNARWTGHKMYFGVDPVPKWHPSHYHMLHNKRENVEDPGDPSDSDNPDKQPDSGSEDKEQDASESEEDSDDQGQASASTAPTLTNTPGVGSVGGLVPYAQTWQNTTNGANWTYQPRRQLNVTADDVATISTNQIQYVTTLYDAVRHRPAQSTAKQQQMIVTLEKKLGKIEATQRDDAVQSACAVVVEQIIQLHTNGDHLRADQVKPQKADKTMKATERFEIIRATLENTKQIVIDMLAGKDKIALLVAAPSKYRYGKYANAKNNARKKNYISKGMKAMKRS